MAADNCIHVVLVNPAGNLIQRTVAFNPGNGSGAVEQAVKSALEVVAVFVERDVEGDAGGPFWDEYSGNSQYSIVAAYDGVTTLARRDRTSRSPTLSRRPASARPTGPCLTTARARTTRRSSPRRVRSSVCPPEGQ